MNGQLLFGLVCCIGLFFYFMFKGRTRDVTSIVAVVLGCVVIMAVCAYWGGMLPNLLSHTVSASAPTPVPTVAVAPTPTPHPTTAAVQTVPTSSPAASSSSANDGIDFGLGVGLFFLVVIIFFIAQVSRARARMQRQVRSAPTEGESSDVPANVRW